MKESNIKKSDSYNKNLAMWVAVLFVIAPLGFIASLVGGKLSNDMFSIYFDLLLSNCISIVGGILWFIGALLIQGKFLFSKGKYKSASICLILLIIVSGWVCKSAGNGYVYKNVVSFTKDFSYVSSKTYCEKTEELNKIYKTESIGKGRHVTISVETETNKYQVFDNIADEKNYDEFKSKFKKCKTVKVKYLPNTNLLLSIEPLEE